MKYKLTIPLKFVSHIHWAHNFLVNFGERTTLDIPSVSAQRIILKSKGNLISDENVSAVFYVLKKYGFSANTVIQQPLILKLSPVAVENYILCMKETGFYDIQPQMIFRFPQWSKRSIMMLKSCNTIPKQDEIVKQYCQVLELTNETEERIWASLPKNMEHISLTELRKTVMAQYFSVRLDTTADEARKIMTTYPRTYYRCLAWVKDTLDVLMNTVELSKTMIKKHGYLLQSNPKNIADIMSRIDQLSGIDIMTFVHMRPKVLMTQCSTLLEIRSLFENTISNEAIAKYPAVYTLSPGTIRERLEELKSIPEFAALQQHPRIGRLIYYQNKVKSRLEYLSSNKMTGASLHILSTDGKRFEKFVSLGEMKTKGSDVIHYLADHFNKHKSEVRKKLMLHHHWLQIPLLKVEDTLRYLESLKDFPQSAIFDCLHILLYPKEKIKKEMEFVLESKESTLKDAYFLHMVMYFMEREVHFTGDGVWQHKIGNDEEEFIQKTESTIDAKKKSDGALQASALSNSEVCLEEANPLRLMPNQ